ncbi:MAG: outer membrane protein assembly factor BamD [Calditrichaeota bacterium]|nr:outer membrane protein assembly factor BamD [Calditrichota bacterium]
MLFRYSLVSLVLIALIACSGDDSLKQRKLPEVELKEALELFKEGDYQEAKEALYTITIKHAGTSVAEVALFYLGETNFKIDKFLVAAHHYGQLLERYNKSEYLEESQYKQALCHYNLSPATQLDQKYTHMAIRYYDQFISDWPQSRFRDQAEKELHILNEKLAEKELINCQTYFKMGKDKAAILYADMAISKFKDSSYLGDLYLLKARAYVERGEWIKSEEQLQLFAEKFGEPEKYQELIAEIKAEIDEGKKEALKNDI